jgi:hypothetical protein
MSENALNTLTVQQLKRAVAIKERIARLEKELAGLLGVSQPNTAKTPRRRKMSAAGRARIAAAAKARWAKVRAAKKS